LSPDRNAALEVVAVLSLGAIAWAWARSIARRSSRRAIRRFRARVNRFKLTRKQYIRTTLLADAAIMMAVKAHSAEHGMTDAQVWARVDKYIDEIVPHFNIFAYYRAGYVASRTVLNFLYKVSLDYEDLSALERLPEDSVVIYLINHKSNADYVLLAYVLAGDVSISYAVGEWARAFPLEFVFKSFGSYFIRRRYREPLYHTVLERYVQLITRNGVTQGIFPEGGLSRDGRLKPAKIGLLDYALGVAKDPDVARRMVLIPVALNYDRVLEDRTLIRELRAKEGGERVHRVRQAREVLHYMGWNVTRALTGRWKRYGRAAVTVGKPFQVQPWLEAQRAQHGDVLSLPREQRLPVVQTLCDEVMTRIGAIVPVTPVALACAAIQSFDRDFIPRAELLARMEEMREVLVELNAKMLRADRDIAETFDRAWRMLSMRRMLAQTGNGYAVLPGSRELVSYYANGIAHLLGDFEAGVRARDALPMERVTGGAAGVR
jgi:glycerol-3-phosphate O-acyltransferase